MADDFTVIGLDEFIADLDQLPLTVSKKFVAKALRAGAKPIQQQMIANAPDDPKTPGSRARNIDINVSEQTANHAIAYIGPTKKGFMAGWAELGSKHQRAKPFMGPAFDAKVNEAVQIIGENLGASIERELKKNG